MDGAFAIETEAGSIDGTIGPDAITGTLTLAGATASAFSAEDVSADRAGLWRGETDALIAGVIVNDADELRGAIRSRTTTEVLPVPMLSTDGTLEVDGSLIQTTQIVSPRDL